VRPWLSSGSAYGPARRYVNVPSGLSLHRSGEQVAVSVLEYLVRENGEEFASRKDAKDAKFGKIKVEAAKTNGLGGGAFASLASWREKKSED
jgi:hypothetical protein